MLRWSLSSWSVHGLLSHGWPLTELPGEMARRGIRTLEICHFHLDPATIPDVRAAARDEGVELFSVLIDTGDIVQDDPAGDLAEIRRWIDVAAELGAKGVRIDAGRREPSEIVIRRSADALRDLFDYGQERGVFVFTENWHETSREAGPLLRIMDETLRPIGLCADTGNAEGPDKYETLKQLFPRATSCHFKARYVDGVVESEDIARCVEILRASDFNGPVSLIYDRDGGGWDGIERLKSALAGPLGLP